MELVRLLGERLLAAGGRAIPTKEALQGASTVGLYFSASWCPPCRGFTPQLVTSYSQSLEAKGFKCVLVSWDQDAASFGTYFDKMPWLALPYEDQQRKDELNKQFSVRSIPTLALVDSVTGATITTEARESLVRDPEGKDFPWRPPLVRDLAMGHPGRINEQPSLVCLCEEAGHQEALDGLNAVAQEASTAENDFGFFVGSGGALCAKVRELCDLPAKGGPQLLLLDIPNSGGFYLGPSGYEALEAKAMQRFLAEYKSGGLQRRQLK